MAVDAHRSDEPAARALEDSVPSPPVDAEQQQRVSEIPGRSREGVRRMLATAPPRPLPAAAAASVDTVALADAVFDRVYVANAERLAALGRVLTGDVEAGRDLTQDVFMELLVRLREDPTFLRRPAWGYLRHALICTARNRHRRLLLEARRMVLFWQPHGHDDVERDATTFELLNALAELPDRMRQCSVLAFLEEMTYAEIAGAMGTSISTVDNQLRRARQRLGARLALLDADIVDPLPLGGRGR